MDGLFPNHHLDHGVKHADTRGPTNNAKNELVKGVCSFALNRKDHF